MKPIFYALAGLYALSAVADEATFPLAQELLIEEQYPLAAVEFRRAAMEHPDPSGRAGAYLYAGYTYLQNRNAELAGEMIDHAENADENSQYTDEIALLSAENAYLSKDWGTALYFYDVLAADASEEASRSFALRKAAVVHMKQGDLSAARERIEQLQETDAQSMQALDIYAAGKNKSPRIGGLLGLIPGAGYWYSGEIANGLRSLILNSIFIYGMVETGQDDQWGAFAVITFFEITWYSGSVYGGVDAAHRYNKDRLDTAIQGIEHGMSYHPDPGITVPLFKLNFEF